MKKTLVQLFIQTFVITCAIFSGIFTVSLVAITISGSVSTWGPGDILRATDLNTTITSLKTAIESVPNWTKSGNDTYYNTGNVGIGTATPISKLDVSGGLASNYSYIQTNLNDISALGSANGRGLHLQWNRQPGTGASFIMNQKGSGAGGIYFGEVTGTTFTTGMQLSGAGNLGIGLINTNYKLGVGGSTYLGGNTQIAGDLEFPMGAVYNHIGMSGGNSRGYIYGSYAKLLDGLHFGYNYYADAGGNDQIPNVAGPTTRISVGYGEIQFATGGINTAPTNRVKIDVSGYLWYLGIPGGGTNNLCYRADGLLGQCSSSKRYKSNIRDLALGLDVVEKLRPVAFDWKSGGAHKDDIGFVAEEVHDIDPKLVTYAQKNPNEVVGVKYSQISAVLVNAIKELKKENDALKQRLDNLEKNSKTQ